MSGIMPPSAVNEVVHGIDRAAGCRRGDHGEQGGGHNAEPHLLALHVAAGETQCVEGGGARRFGPVGHDDAGNEQHAHGGEDGPTLALVADRAAEHVGERRPDREDRNHLHEVRQRGRVLERMGRVGVEEAAAIGAEHLDGDLRGDRPDRDGLLRTFQRGRFHIRAERLRNTLPDQEQRVNDADRQQDVERAAGDIDPEIPDGPGRCARKTADQRHGERNPGRCGKEVLVRQAKHLHQVGHGAFAAVVLPIGVGDEAHRGIERQILRDRALLRRIERQQRLEAHQAVEDQKTAEMEEQHGDRIGEPMLLAPRIDTAGPVERRLNRLQQPVKATCARR